MTPHYFAQLSPILLDIASPGYLTSLLHTRIGPILFPVTADSNWSRRPFAYIILSRSSGKSGL